MNEYLIICDDTDTQKLLFDKFCKFLNEIKELDRASYVSIAHSTLCLKDGSRYTFILRRSRDHFTRGFRGDVVEGRTLEYMMELFKKCIENGNQCTFSEVTI